MSGEIRPVPTLIFENPHALTEDLHGLEDNSSAEERSSSEDENIARAETSPPTALASDLFNPYGTFMNRIMESRHTLLSGFESSERDETFNGWVENIRNVLIDVFEKIITSHVPLFQQDLLMGQLGGGFNQLNLVVVSSTHQEDQIALRYKKKCDELIKK